MKTVFKACLIAVMAGVVLWSCKDDFTDEDLLNKQNDLAKDSIQLSVVVYDASSSFLYTDGKGPTDSDGGRTSSTKGVAGLTVAFNVNGTVVTQTTDANGIAVFSGMQPGIVAGVVSGTGFTTTNFSLKLSEGQSVNGANEPLTYAGAVVPVFETTGTNVATVSGKVTAETDLLNNTRENVPNGTKISFSIDTESESFSEVMSALNGLYEDISSNTIIESISFEGNFVATVQNGAYTINLPVAHKGLDYTFLFSEFTADQKIAINNLEHDVFGSLRSVQTISTSFRQVDYLPSNSTTYIPYLSPIQFDIAAPPAAGSGATATISLLPAALASSGFTVLASGSGYTPSVTNIPVTITGGSFDNSVTGATAAVVTASSNAAGQITGINVTTAGFGYRSQATLTIGGGGTGAVVRVNYASTIAPLFGTGTSSGTSLTAGGSGYVVAPSVVYQGFSYDNNQAAATGSTTVSGGSVVNFTVPGTSFAKAPTVTFVPVTRTPASVYPDNINYGYADVTNGYITYAQLSDVGSGYDPLNPPSVTVRDLRGGGTGAVVTAITETGGTLEYGLSILSRGSGYSQLTYANYPTSYQGFSLEGNYYYDSESQYVHMYVKPGTSKILNAHYGTGYKSVGVE